MLPCVCCNMFLLQACRQECYPKSADQVIHRTIRVSAPYQCASTLDFLFDSIYLKMTSARNITSRLNDLKKKKKTHLTWCFRSCQRKSQQWPDLIQTLSPQRFQVKQISYSCKLSQLSTYLFFLSGL